VSKHIDGQKLEQRNQNMKEAGTYLRKERDGLQLHHEKQLARLHFFGKALESSRERLSSLLDEMKLPLQSQFDRADGRCKRRVRSCLFRVSLSYIGDIEILQAAKQCRENYRLENSYVISDSL
jgi:hypothetical protein